jgi:hypothetical protein
VAFRSRGDAVADGLRRTSRVLAGVAVDQDMAAIYGDPVAVVILRGARAVLGIALRGFPRACDFERASVGGLM